MQSSTNIKLGLTMIQVNDTAKYLTVNVDGSPNGGGGDRRLGQPMPSGKGDPGPISSRRTSLRAIYKIGSEEQATRTSRLMMGILNKLTPQNYDTLIVQLVQEANVDSATTLAAVVSQIFDKALMEPTYCAIYAQLCVKIAADFPEFTENDKKISFRRVLLNKCHEEFDGGVFEDEADSKGEEEPVEINMTSEEREDKYLKARRRKVGNLRFINELFKKGMLPRKIIIHVIITLLKVDQNLSEENVEGLCMLMNTVGPILAGQKIKGFDIDACFRQIISLSKNLKFSSRLRFLLNDCTARRIVRHPFL